MSDVEAELRAELREALADVEFPITDQMELVPALPNGLTTTFEAGDGDVRLTAMELGTELAEYQSFPYENLDALLDDVMEGLRAEGIV